MQNKAWAGWGALGVVYLVWGSIYVASRFMVESMPPLVANGTRFVAAGIVLVLVIASIAGPGALRVDRRQLGTAALGGLLLPACGTGAIVLAAGQIASGVSALLIASIPLYVVLLRTLLGDRPRPVTYLGVAVGLVGLVVLLLGGPGAGAHGSNWAGLWIVLAGAVAWAVGSVATTRMPVPANPFTLSAYQMLVGGAVLVLVGLLRGERVALADVTGTSWTAWAYLLVFGSVVGFSAYVYALRSLPVSTVATYAYVNPVVAVLLGVVLANEEFGGVRLLGGLVVLVAVVLVLRSEKRPS